MQNKTVIVLDIDGCLISETGSVDKNYYLSLSWLAEYIRAANVGEHPNICLCSGRNAIFVEAVSYLIGWPQFPAIVENGTAFFDPLTKEFKINPRIPQKTIFTLKRISRKIVPAILRKYPNFDVSFGQRTNITFVKRSKGNAVSLESFRDILRKHIAKFLKRKILKTIMLENAVSIAPSKINKGEALLILSEEKGLDLKRCIGIGDSKLDISFLEKTGLVGCPQNADEICKKLVKEKNGRVSKFSHAEGVADIIKWFFLKE